MQSQDPIYFAPQRKLGGGWICWKDSPSPPPAPDYTGAAQATAAGNLQAAQVATQANRVNQYSPYGSSTYTQTPSAGYTGTGPDPNATWSQNIDLSPVGQQLLDASNNSQLGTAALEQGAGNQVAAKMSQPFNLGGAQDATNQAYSNITSRLDPQWQQNSQQQAASLANQGITQGSEAYNNAMRTFNQAKNDAYTQANTTAMNFAPQTYQMDLSAYNQPLNALNALRSASQVTTPQFGAVPQQGQTGGPNYSGATQATGAYDQNIYNQQVGMQNSTIGALGSLGGAALMAPIGTFGSDIRIKENIVRIGRMNGLNLYEYDYKPAYRDLWGHGRQVGVLAQEVLRVRPDAVSQHPEGYLMVDYEAL